MADKKKDLDRTGSNEQVIEFETSWNCNKLKILDDWLDKPENLLVGGNLGFNQNKECERTKNGHEPMDTSASDTSENSIDSNGNEMKNPPKADTYVVEFRVVVDENCTIPDAAVLMVYIRYENRSYPMRYNSKLQAYEFRLEVPLMHRSLIYKFVYVKAEERNWEKVPFRNFKDVWNRICFMHDEERRKNGLFVIFDAVSFNEKSITKYKEWLQSSLFRLIPLWDNTTNTNVKSNSGSREVNLALQLFEQWVETFFDAKHFVDNADIGFEQITCDSSQELLAPLLQSKIDLKEAGQVIGSLCLFLSVCKKIRFMEPSLKKSLCCGMSLEELDDEHLLVFRDQFQAVITHFNATVYRDGSKSSFELTLKNIFRQLEDIPEYIFVLPLLKLAQCRDLNEIVKSPPSRDSWEKFRNKLRTMEENQRSFFELREKVFKLSQRFTWIETLFVETLNLEQTSKLLNTDLKLQVPARIFIDKLSYFWKQLNHGNSRENLTPEAFVSLHTYAMDHMNKKYNDYREKRDVANDQVQFFSYVISKCLEIIKDIKRYGKSCNLDTSFVAHTLHFCEGALECAHVLTKKNGSKEIENKSKTLRENLLVVAKSIVTDGLYVSSTVFNIKLLNCLSETEWSDSKFKESWLNVLHEAVSEVFRRKVFRDQKELIEYYCDRFEKQNPNTLVSEWFAEVMSNVFVDYVNSQTSSINILKKAWKMFKSTFSGSFESKIIAMCPKILDQQWKSCPKYEDDGEKFLGFIQEWDILFLQTMYEYKLADELPPELKNKIESIDRSAYHVVADLDRGMISLKCLLKLDEVKREFYDCLEMIQLYKSCRPYAYHTYDGGIPISAFPNDTTSNFVTLSNQLLLINTSKKKSSSVDFSFTRNSFCDLVALRVRELKKFSETKLAIDNFIHLIQSLTQGKVQFNCDGIDQKLAEDVSNSPLNRLVSCRRNNANIEPRTADQRVVFFPLPPKDIAFVVELQRSDFLPLRSEVIKNQLTKVVSRAQANDVEQLTFSEALEILWKPMRQKMKKLVQSIDEGTISLKQVDKIFCGNIKVEHDEKSLKMELDSLYRVTSSTELSTVKKNIHFLHLDSYFRMKGNFVGAQLLEDARSLLELEGDFSDLAKLLELEKVRGDLPLSAVDEDIQGINESIQITNQGEHYLATLEKFVACQALVLWLKQHIKDSKEVKVMTDLAMIAAGETPMEVDRVSSFNSAVLGFAPLIFNLTSESGLKELLEACKQVWSNVDADPTILDKWEEAGKQLGWLDFVAGFEGSVEKSSLEKAQMINTRGFYLIQCEEGAIPSVKNSIKLILVEENKRTTMTLSELRDLQSRLMLIAGEAVEGKEDVTKFMNLLSSVENLAKTYVKLKTSGCSLFCDWSANVRCANEGKQSVTVEVYFDKKCQSISTSGDIIDELVNLTEVLDEAYCQWMEYLVLNRNKYYHLNHFNIQQLTFLCKELACGSSANFKDQVYQLLASVLPQVDREAIIDCRYEAMEVDDGDEHLESISVAEDEENLSVNEKKRNMVKKLMRMEVSEQCAKAAVQSVGFDDEENCLIWALTNGTDCEELAKEFDDDIGFESNRSNIRVIHNIVNDRSSSTLKQVISQLQSDAYSDTANLATIVKTICERYFVGTSVTSLEDCLSLQHCGKFLECLGNRVNVDILPRREWSDHFISGKPNLLICRQTQDMLLILLSLYMYSPAQALPSASEVLLCSEHTTAEEVELLFRRAIEKQIDCGERVYCLAYADLLPFDVSKKAEECFDELMQLDERNDKFKLVILTCSHQHYLTSCFYEHKVEGYRAANNDDIKKYLEQQFSHKATGSLATKVNRNGSSVMVVRSKTSGMGKSLYVSRCRDKVLSASHPNGVCNSSTVRLLEKEVDVDDVITTLTSRGKSNSFSNADSHFVHIDITPSVQVGKSKFIFELTILGMIESNLGVIWRHAPNHLYMIEYTDAKDQIDEAFDSFFNLLPSVGCLSPVEVQEFLQQNPIPTKPDNEIHMDAILLRSDMYQRPFQYLRLYSANEDMDHFTYTTPDEDPFECLNTLLGHCSLTSPSWSELSHFSKFLNTQLANCEQSVFCNLEALGADSGFGGFKKFVVQFMIRMSQDFATPSLYVDDEDENRDVGLLELHQLRRRWESGFHPYVFFNNDRHSMSFANFNVNDQGFLCKPKTQEEIEELMQPCLVAALKRNSVNLQQNINEMSREDKLAILSQVFGVETVFDPDATYELTTDNVVKMLAIQMRFRCGIPVVIMGETGCGKTRMIDFMSKLKAEGRENIQNMIVVKVHGGVTSAMVQEKVLKAIKLAEKNKAESKLETILFFDEANTTEAVYAIKEIMCDETVRGKPFADSGLKIVAACNPYRTHTDEVIEAMEKSGLGFHVKSENVCDTFDGKPMRHLVYRVISLPPSMHPLVWDFGQLNNDTESVYIKQMVLQLQTDMNQIENLPPLNKQTVNTITRVITASQAYMREQRDVCRFVSLRDAERTIQSFKWFYEHLLFLNPMIEKLKEEDFFQRTNVSYGIRALILSLSICYYVTLDERTDYRRMIAEEISRCEEQDVSDEDVLEEIVACQNVFINAIELEKNIACNEALRENVFMMVMCAEMRIPLFLVGKPGSSKSLAKTIVTDAMQGKSSKHELYRRLKEIHVLSFQCSAATDAVGIEAVFSQCVQLQRNNKDCSKYVATVVLDEIGLAEDSKKMPLKVLHPLLEATSTDDSLTVDPFQKVGFVGISNWALDPAKMNRGIFVTRGKPSQNDLHKTAEAIFESDKHKLFRASKSIKAVTDAYLEIYEEQEKEFFGLRDYYAMMKMLYASSSLTFAEIGRAVVRNFSGNSDNVLLCFEKHCRKLFENVQSFHIPVTELIRNNLNPEFESRFLMLLTKQYSAVNLLPEVLGNRDYIVIFGSSFPHDHDYTEVCRNINKIKVCMETGRTVVLLNLRDLYESLYDALNQHYVTLAGQRYVDLGLGGHRVKCRIAPDFRLVVIEEKEIVHDKYPIPLINRLEKHVFEMGSILVGNQIPTVNRLKEWVEDCCKMNTSNFQGKEFSVRDTFVGYNDDSCASALLSVREKSFEAAQRVILQTASLDGVCRFPRSDARDDFEALLEIYMQDQVHDSLWIFLREELQQNRISVTEVLSFSQVLHEKDKQNLINLLGLAVKNLMLLTLQQFQTEQQFSERVDEFLQYVDEHCGDGLSSVRPHFVLLVQCSRAHLNGSLVACAKYSAINQLQKFQQEHLNFNGSFAVCFLLTLERQAAVRQNSESFANFYCADCETIYIDELKPKSKPIAPVTKLWNLTIQDVITDAIDNMDGETALVDMRKLIRESIPIAMAKLQSRVTDLNRNRIQLMLFLCFETASLRPFLDILLAKIQALIEDRRKKLSGRDAWIIEQACSSHLLQEGGTFRNVLWLWLRNLVASAIAKIVSVADADNNLDLLVESSKTSPKLTDLWFQTFDQNNYWDLQWTSMKVNESSSNFVVEGKMGFSSAFPFARLIYDVLLKEWSLVRETNAHDQHRAFLLKISSSPILRLLDAAEEIGVEALDCFANDLVHLMYKSRSQADNSRIEIEIIKSYILNMHRAQRNSPNAYRSNALLELFILIIDNTKHMQTFAEVVCIQPEITNERSSWIRENNHTFLLHHSAFASLITQLDAVAKDSFGPVDACHQWKSCVAQSKQVASKLLPLSEDVVKKMWQRILFVEMFLDELLPNALPQDAVKRYLKPLAKQARMLWSGAVAIKDLSKLRFLKIVINTLKKCVKEMELRLLCDWKDINCKACKKELLIQPVMLPCRHYFCQRCVTQNPGNKCPYCRYDITETDVLEPMQLTSSQENELKMFKLACTSFFLEYLSNVCFPHIDVGMQHMNLVDGDMLLALEELVVNEKGTKAISPVQVEMDLNPTARSYILQLLLRCDERLVEKQLEGHFQRMEEVLKDRTALMGLYIKCKEDILHQKSLKNDENAEESYGVVFAVQQLRNAVHSLQNAASFNQVEHLGTCAVLQFVAKSAASCIMQTIEESTSEEMLQRISIFFRILERSCNGPEYLILRQFVIKCLCRRYGTDSMSIMLDNDMFRKLVPENLLSEADQEKENYFLADKLSLSGETYLKTKTLLLDIAQESDEEGMLQQIFGPGNLSRDETVQVLLAVSVWTAYDLENDSRQRMFQSVIQRLNTSVGSQFCREIVRGRMGVFKCNNVTSNMQYCLTELLIQFGVTLETSQNGLLQQFRNVVQNPSLMPNMFLPTMPGSDMMAVQGGITGLRPHLCPNGHQYFIGECGRPQQETSCPDCGVRIGGTGHRLAQGNYQGVMTEQSQAGYKVRNANGPVVSERNLSNRSVCATRICLHLAMILGSRHGNEISRMMNCTQGQEVDYLFQQIQYDMKQLSTSIGRSVDDVFMLMHLVLNTMRVAQSPPQQNCDWDSLDSRRAWEDAFQRLFLAPIISDVTARVNQARDVMIGAGKLTEKPLEKLVYELKEDDPLPDGIVPWNCPNLWKYMLHIDIRHLQQYLDGVDANSNGAALKVIINSENLEMVRYLYVVVTLQAVFIKKYRQKIDMANAENITIEEFLAEENFMYEEDVNTYIQVWNKVKNFPLNLKRYNAPLSILDDDMSLDSPISMCLPSRRGKGLCALLVAEYLIDQQNNVLALCRELVKPTPSFETVNVGDLDTNDLINMSFVEDLMPLLLENSQYETTVTDNGLQHNITYNLILLQKKVLQKFILGKRIINRETIPLMKYPQDMGLTNDFQAVQSQDKQVPLPLKICQDVDDTIEKALTAKLCEVVRTLALVIQFLAKNKSVKHDRRISDYAEKELLLPSEETEMIPRSAQICHCLARYERLSWHRSKRLIENGQNPFENVMENAEEVFDSLQEKLKQELTNINLNRMQLELNALLMVGPAIDNGDWSLGDILQPYVEGKYEDADTTWCEQIPEEILYKHSVHVFHLSMELTSK